LVDVLSGFAPDATIIGVCVTISIGVYPWFACFSLDKFNQVYLLMRYQ
jgi:hypothetical protein